MGALFDQIRRAVGQERFVVSDHADERLRERGIMVWQAAHGIDSGKLLLERPDADPNPIAEVGQALAAGTSIKAVFVRRGPGRGHSCHRTLLQQVIRMLLPGKPIKLTKWIHGRACVVRVQVDAIRPDAQPDTPVLEPATIKWLDELQRLADAGEVELLAKAGDVYVRRSA